MPAAFARCSPDPEAWSRNRPTLRWHLLHTALQRHCNASFTTCSGTPAHSPSSQGARNFWHAVELTNYVLLWFHVLNVVQKYVLGTNARFFSGSPGNLVTGPKFVPTGSLFDFQALVLEIYALNLLLSYIRLVKFFQMMTGVNMAVRVLGKVRLCALCALYTGNVTTACVIVLASFCASQSP